MSFPATMNQDNALAIEGDFASANPRSSFPAGEGQLVSGTSCYAGRFAWADPSGTTLNSQGTGNVLGFVGRHQTSLLTTFLSEASLQILAGTAVTPYIAGDFWVRNNGTTTSAVGNKAYAAYASGLASFGPTGNPPAAASVTGSIAANATNTFTGSITGNILNVTASVVGTIVAGSTLSGTGVTSGTTIVQQLTGTPGGIGTYQVSTPQTVASTTITGAYGVLTVTAVGSGTLGVGDVLSGTGVAAGTIITQLGTGTGGTGTYYVNNSTVVSSTTISATAAVETKWYAMSVGAPGELVKISNHAPM
jgi:hypothetical protein